MRALGQSRLVSTHRVWWSARGAVGTGSSRVGLRLDVQDDGIGSARCPGWASAQMVSVRMGQTMPIFDVH